MTASFECSSEDGSFSIFLLFQRSQAASDLECDKCRHPGEYKLEYDHPQGPFPGLYLTFDRASGIQDPELENCSDLRLGESKGLSDKGRNNDLSRIDHFMVRHECGTDRIHHKDRKSVV